MTIFKFWLEKQAKAEADPPPTAKDDNQKTGYEKQR
jgi:hypothetical protein